MDSPLTEWSGRSVVVTGAARGLGAAYARAFSALGARVVCVDRLNDVSSVASDIRSSGGRACAHLCDLGDADAISRLGSKILAETPKLALLINNAGIAYGDIVDRSAVRHFQHADWTRFLAINTVAPVILAELLRPALAEAKGTIINQSSMASTDPATAYGVTKAALNAMTRAMAVSFADDGIRVNAIAPGLIIAEALGAGLSVDHAARVREGQLLDRAGTAEDIVGVAMFLASDAARCMTGEIIFCDGGSHRRHWRY